MPKTAPQWTAEMVRALPDDGKRYEVVDGELFVAPAPSWDHQRAVGAIYRRLHAYLSEHKFAEVLVAPADLELDEYTLVQPDLFVFPRVPGRVVKSWGDVESLLLAVEVLSPTTARADRTVKRKKYQRVGVPEYWIVDVDARLVERWRQQDERPELITDSLSWQPNPSALPLVIDLPGLFAEALGGE